MNLIGKCLMLPAVNAANLARFRSSQHRIDQFTVKTATKSEEDIRGTKMKSGSCMYHFLIYNPNVSMSPLEGIFERT